ncbi:type II and III secretion system protein family protein [Sphingomonas sp. BN140010]|uniref:Type II and III secretion system protein family protein n=1 Tax=Sphingomonas arvum TaxID=2992113 RepID=A0ABT3JDL3_9SPHN|nr:type II and III secretion system protein family protein [Sphingomonas sp. BN140010]MCW3797154.1 type II and III secretion system protein family protein [Sphingomonas sp. BN140010]
MIARNLMRRASLGTAAAAISLGVAFTGAAPANAQSGGYSGTYRPTSQVQLSVGEGQMITLPSNVANVWTSNPKVADVLVNSPRQLNLFGKDFGEATVIATSANGSVVYGAQVRVSQNLPTVNDVLKAVMPESDVRVTTIGQTAILSGTVASPEDASLAARLATSELNPGVDMSQPGALCKICVVNRLRTATPLQVALKVRVAEVNRSLLKSIGVNLLSRDATSGFQFGIGQGSPGTFGTPATQNTPAVPKSFNIGSLGTTLGAAGKLFGLDVLSTLDLAAKDGLVTLLAEPTLTALSGETASFLAGGEFPIPVSQSLGTLSIEYKQYGVGLAFTPVVLADGRISMRVRPEVSELSNEGSVRLNGYVVPALTTRRAETTVELGSGQSFMIAGLLRNTNTNDVSKAPFLGDLPVLGALFRSTSFRRQETELVIIVTPYLVRPVSGQLASPADGYRAPSDPELNLEGQTFKGVSGPRPTGPVPGPGVSAAAAPAATAPTPGFKL